MNTLKIRGWWQIRMGQWMHQYAVISGNSRMLEAGQRKIIAGRILIEDGIFKSGLKKIFSARYPISLNSFERMEKTDPVYLVRVDEKFFKLRNKFNTSTKDQPFFTKNDLDLS
jgi:hypothetical protein